MDDIYILTIKTDHGVELPGGKIINDSQSDEDLTNYKKQKHNLISKMLNSTLIENKSNVHDLILNLKD